jgi:histidinol phosphatase-like enzyme (inositol monophosphatase family)
MTKLLEASLELAQLTGRVALDHYRKNLRERHLLVERKGDGSPVSAADRASEEAARAWLAERFPDDGILGEELGASKPDAKRVWCIDPIDGTKSFLAGAPLWGSLVAVVEGREVLAGAAVFPVTDEAIAAAVGEGLAVIGAKAGVSEIAELAEATVLTTDERFTDAPDCVPGWRALAQAARISRTWGDCYGYWLVATGRAELMTDGTLSPWDAACWIPIIEQAGGVFTDWRGERTAFGLGGIATNAKLADEARRMLGVPLGGAVR